MAEAASPVGVLADEVRLAARAQAPDLYMTAVFAPRPRQAHLIALAAFVGDIERIVATVSEPAIAEIRLQWWRDAIYAACQGGLTQTGHPAADALGAAIRAHRLPFAEFDGLLDARALDLYADPLPDEAALNAYFDKTDGAAFRLAARCLGADDPSGSALIKKAAIACGTARLICRMPVFLARGRASFAGMDALNGDNVAQELDFRRSAARNCVKDARGLWRHSSRAERSACLSLALVEPYLKASEQRGHDPARSMTEVEPLLRMWRLWQAHVLGRI